MLGVKTHEHDRDETMVREVPPADLTYGDLSLQTRAHLDAILRSAIALDAAARSGGLPYGPVIRDILGDVLEYGAAIGAPVTVANGQSPDTK